ncbi:MAG: MotA/TolQ/ExbB proton channel family protein [Acidobacteria bacterium]|nr:MotA/TolQ/ExbB proton channel family protein [Acidobacteriota bacterium]MDW7983626.1 MotA/TolQ/ExbB proton channel family protein [Acidobacteriota bacterium]
MQVSLIEIWHAMGWVVRIVAFVMLGMSIWSLVVAIDKFLLFRRARKQSIRFVEALTQELDKRNLQQALELTRQKEFRHSHVAKIVNHGLQEFLRIMETSAHVASANPHGTATTELEEAFQPHKALERTQHAMERASILEIHEFKRGLSTLATVGATAPFVGLFGTVIGIINAFQAIKTAGAAAIGQVSGGIAEALVMTAFGLLVAIPAVWLYNYFTVRVERIQHEMGNIAADLLDYLVDVQEVMYAKRV